MCVCVGVCKVNKAIIVGCRCVLVPSRLQQRFMGTMAPCWRTHLSQSGEVRGPDRRKITQEQTSLNQGGGATRGLKERGEIKVCRNVEGGEKNTKEETKCGERKRSSKRAAR